MTISRNQVRANYLRDRALEHEQAAKNSAATVIMWAADPNAAERAKRDRAQSHRTSARLLRAEAARLERGR